MCCKPVRKEPIQYCHNCEAAFVYKVASVVTIKTLTVKFDLYCSYQQCVQIMRYNYKSFSFESGVNISSIYFIETKCIN